MGGLVAEGCVQGGVSRESSLSFSPFSFPEVLKLTFSLLFLSGLSGTSSILAEDKEMGEGEGGCDASKRSLVSSVFYI